MEIAPKSEIHIGILNFGRKSGLDHCSKKQDKLIQGDHVYILADKNHVKRTMSAFGHDEKPIRKIIITQVREAFMALRHCT